SSCLSTGALWAPLSFPTRRSADLPGPDDTTATAPADAPPHDHIDRRIEQPLPFLAGNGPLETILEINSRVSTRTARRSMWSCGRSEEHTSELQSRENLVCRLLLDK